MVSRGRALFAHHFVASLVRSVAWQPASLSAQDFHAMIVVPERNMRELLGEKTESVV
jgi:hypothetical protein